VAFPEWAKWVAIDLVFAVFVYTRFAGKTSSADARALVASGARLVDVRTPGEYQSAHIEGALNVPLDQLSARMAELGPKDGAIVVYCQSGGRSGSAASMLRSAGFTRVSDLGAMSRW
jgi:rhodanese-related sulfurtransferase